MSKVAARTMMGPAIWKIVGNLHDHSELMYKHPTRVEQSVRADWSETCAAYSRSKQRKYRRRRQRHSKSLLQKLEDGDARLEVGDVSSVIYVWLAAKCLLSWSQAGPATFEIPPPAPMIHREPMKAENVIVNIQLRWARTVYSLSKFLAKALTKAPIMMRIAPNRKLHFRPNVPAIQSPRKHVTL